MKKSWVIYRGGLSKHPRRKGPGRVNPNFAQSSEPLTLSPREAHPMAPDRPCSMRRAERRKFRPERLG